MFISISFFFFSIINNIKEGGIINILRNEVNYFAWGGINNLEESNIDNLNKLEKIVLIIKRLINFLVFLA